MRRKRMKAGGKEIGGREGDSFGIHVLKAGSSKA